MNNEHDILNNLHQEAVEAAALFSKDGQCLQERTAVAGFLRVLGIDFREEEIIKQGPEPIDVWFRDARFQVTEILDKDRPRNREIKERADRIKKARRLEELIEPGIIASRPMAPDEIVALVSARAKEKGRRYGDVSDGVDLLIYLNLRGRHFPLDQLPALPVEVCACWRSISVVMERFAAVLWAADNAPSFLIERREQSFRWDSGPVSVFPRLSGQTTKSAR